MGIYVLSVNTCPRPTLSLYVLLFICAVRSQRWTQLGRKMDSWVTIEILVDLVGESRTEENTPRENTRDLRETDGLELPLQNWGVTAGGKLSHRQPGSRICSGASAVPITAQIMPKCFQFMGGWMRPTGSWGSWCQFMLGFQQGSHGTH